MKQITVFVAGDGTRFDSEEDCLTYEDTELTAKIMTRVGFSGYQLTAQLSVMQVVYMLKKAVALGVIYLDSPTRTAYNHLRRWLPKDQADLVSAYQDWLQTMGAKMGRTPNAIHLRLRDAYRQGESSDEFIKH